MSALALGIDIAERRGCDYVLMRERSVRDVGRLMKPDDAYSLIQRVRPDVVTIDSPPSWGSSGTTREAERDLHRRGISIFWTPDGSLGVGRRDLRWMQEGFAYFQAAAAAGYPTYTRRTSMKGKALEVFPHASACALSGHLRPARTSKVRFRRDVLQAHGVQVETLTNIDKVDAALAALTGVIAIEGDACAVGSDDEGLIVVPASPLRVRYAPPGP